MPTSNRTVQESKLFPVSPYMILSYFMCFYRYPALLRKIEQHMRAEDIGDRARNMGIKIQNPSMGWCLPSFYLLGREYLIAIGGYRTGNVTEDMDLAVRLHRYLYEHGIKAAMPFIPDPVAWTEVPSSLRVLGRQRERCRREPPRRP